MSALVLLSAALLWIGAGLALWVWGTQQRQRRSMARHLQGLLGSSSVAWAGGADADVHGLGGLNWGPLWLRHRTAWHHVRQALAVAAVVAVLSLVAGQAWLALVVGLAVVAVGALWAWWRWQRVRRQVQEQLPAFLDGMVRMVVLGHSAPSAFLAAAATTKLPLQATLAQAVAFSKAGMPVDQALAVASRHWQLDAFLLLAAILQVGNRFGGRIDTLLDRVSQFLRDREQATRELHALSAEVRLSAWVLSLLPLVVGGLIISMNANYFMQMWMDATGRWLLYAALGLQCSGVLLLARLARLE